MRDGRARRRGSPAKLRQVDGSEVRAGPAGRGPLRLAANGVVLREWAERDLDAMVELFDDPAIAWRTPLPAPFTLADAEERLRRARQPDRMLLAVTTDGKRPLGEVLLLPATGEAGYMIGARHRGRGLAARALVLLRDHAHEALGLPIVRLRIEPDNRPSAAVAARAGFRLVPGAAVRVENKGRPSTVDVWEHATR